MDSSDECKEKHDADAKRLWFLIIISESSAIEMRLFEEMQTGYFDYGRYFLDSTGSIQVYKILCHVPSARTAKNIRNRFHLPHMPVSYTVQGANLLMGRGVFKSNPLIHEFGEMPEKSNMLKKLEKDEIYTRCMSFDSIAEVNDFVLKSDISLFVNNISAIHNAWAILHRPQTKSNFETIDGVSKFNKPFLDLNIGRSYILVGTTGLGKTEFAMAHFKNPLKINMKEDWKNLNSDTDGIVIDDPDYSLNSGSTMISVLDVQQDQSINVKYGSVFIPKNLMRIITCNSLQQIIPNSLKEGQKEAIMRRVKVIHITEPLFDSAVELNYKIDLKALECSDIDGNKIKVDMTPKFEFNNVVISRCLELNGINGFKIYSEMKDLKITNEIAEELGLTEDDMIEYQISIGGTTQTVMKYPNIRQLGKRPICF